MINSPASSNVFFNLMTVFFPHYILQFKHFHVELYMCIFLMLFFFVIALIFCSSCLYVIFFYSVCVRLCVCTCVHVCVCVQWTFLMILKKVGIPGPLPLFWGSKMETVKKMLSVRGWDGTGTPQQLRNSLTLLFLLGWVIQRPLLLGSHAGHEVHCPVAVAVLIVIGGNDLYKVVIESNTSKVEEWKSLLKSQDPGCPLVDPQRPPSLPFWCHHTWLLSLGGLLDPWWTHCG